MDASIRKTSFRRLAAHSGVIASTDDGARNFADPLNVTVLKKPPSDWGTWLCTNHRIVASKGSAVASGASVGLSSYCGFLYGTLRLTR